jgi:hypothetical protein
MLRDRNRVGPEVGKVEVFSQQAAVGVRVGAHAPVAFGGQCPQLGDQPAAWIEQLLGTIAAQPVLEERKVVRILAHVGERHLVRSP